MNIRKIGKAVSGIIFFTLIAKLLGFFREILLACFFGATGISDAYLISQNIPGTIFQFVGTGLTTCFIPVYYEAFCIGGKEKTDEFTNTVITIIMCFSAIVITIIWTFTPSVVKLFASGFTGVTLIYAVQFTRIGVLSLFFSTLIYVYNSYLQANHIFEPTAFAAIPNSLFIIASIYLGAKYNIWILSIGSTLAVGFQLVFLLYPVHRLGFSLKLNLKWKNLYIRKFFLLLLPVIFGVSVNEINTLVDRTIASQVAIGGISALTYANSLICLIQGGIVQPITTVFYPQITEAVANKNNDIATNALEKTLNYTLTILIPIAIAFFAFSSEIVIALFGRGAFDNNGVQMTADSLRFYSIGICFVGLRELLSRFYYAHSNTSIPMKNATIGVLCNITLNLIFSRYFGIKGLALATSISAIVSSFLLWIEADKYLLCGRLRIDFKELVKVCVSSVISIIIAYIILCLVKSVIFGLICAVMISVLAYCVLGVLFKIEFFSILLSTISISRKEY